MDVELAGLEEDCESLAMTGYRDVPAPKYAEDIAVLDRGAIALCSSSKHWVIFKSWVES